jgi:dipeptidyl aminopeptidase/acylaminoacyl peptidase
MRKLLQFLCGSAFVATAGAAMAAGQTTSLPTQAATRVEDGVALRSAETFAQLPGIENPEISPDGKRVAARIAVRNRQYLAVFEIAGGQPRLIDPTPAEINWWHWVNDEWLVMGAGKLVPFEADQWYVSRAYGVSASSAKIVPLVSNAAQDADDVLWTAKDGSSRILLAYQTSVYEDDEGFWPRVDEVDVSTGKTKPVVAPHGGVMSWYADGSGVVRIGVGHSKDGRDVHLLYRADPKATFRTVQNTTAANEDLIVPALFLPDRDKALTYANDEHGFRALYELDLKTLERGRQVMATPGFDLGGLVPDSAGTGFLGVGVSGERSGMRWVDPDMQAIETELRQYVNGGRSRIESFDRSRTHVIFYVGSPDSPGAYFIYDRAKHEVAALDFVNQTLKLHRLNPVQTIHYQARDGLDISAVLTKPAGKTGALPLIVMPHGGPFARDYESWDWIAQFMATRGYVVVQPNYRGSSGFGAAFAERGQGQWGLAMQDDLNDAVTALAKQGVVDPKRVCMVGASYGGYAAIRAAQRDGALYRCAVSFAGISDMNKMLRTDSRFLNSGASHDWTLKQAPDLKSVSSINFIDQFSIPLLLVHGTKDQVVAVGQSRSLASKLKAAGKTVEYVEQPEGDHHFSRYEDRLSFLKALEAWLDKYNPA